ncbi:MAG: YcbK family protein [Candidatus Competibacteraceae bacterium]|nr:YcbK family protein [Candidatus Competibacteraceae bacterium]
MHNHAAPEKQNHALEIQPERVDRRRFLRLAVGGLGASALLSGPLEAATRRERYLSFYNANTGEALRQVYWTPREGYIRQSLKEISWALRDHHNDQVKSFDYNVLDQLYALQLQLRSRSPLHIISAYRSPVTNRQLSRRRRGVARNSYHIQAMALDVRLPDGRVSDLYRAARSLGAGGVGYYPRSNFVHIDSGPVRYWS